MNQPAYSYVLIAATTLLMTYQASAADIRQGKELHDSRCTQCHISIMDDDNGNGNGIYLRKDRFVESLSGLKKQVRQCNKTIGLKWPEDNIQAVVKYLDLQFYKFSK